MISRNQLLCFFFRFSGFLVFVVVVVVVIYFSYFLINRLLNSNCAVNEYFSKGEKEEKKKRKRKRKEEGPKMVGSKQFH